MPLPEQTMFQFTDAHMRLVASALYWTFVWAQNKKNNQSPALMALCTVIPPEWYLMTISSATATATLFENLKGHPQNVFCHW